MNFTQNSTVDSVTTKPGPEVAVPPFERSLEEFSHNCDAMLYELVCTEIKLKLLIKGQILSRNLNILNICLTSFNMWHRVFVGIVG